MAICRSESVRLAAAKTLTSAARTDSAMPSRTNQPVRMRICFFIILVFSAHRENSTGKPVKALRLICGGRVVKLNYAGFGGAFFLRRLCAARKPPTVSVINIAALGSGVGVAVMVSSGRPDAKVRALNR